jgi:hypothetical protein
LILSGIYRSDLASLFSWIKFEEAIIEEALPSRRERHPFARTALVSRLRESSLGVPSVLRVLGISFSDVEIDAFNASFGSLAFQSFVNRGAKLRSAIADP